MKGFSGSCVGLAALLVVAAAGIGAQAQAAEQRDFCADRPGIGTPACTMNPGRVQLELGLGDWAREKDAATRTDSVELGEVLVRVGVTGSTEAQIGWTAFGHVREKDRITGVVSKDSGVGDVTLAIRQNLRNPDGSGFSAAVMPYVTLPSGGSAIGADDWGAGALLPLSFDLGSGLSLEAMGEMDAAVDEDRDGRHLAYGGVLGVGFDLSQTVSAMFEISMLRDNDPTGHATEALSGLSLAWQPSGNMQVDIGTNVGLNHDSLDSEVYLGISRRF
ncbi:transporter [Sphingobium sp. CFD-1]|uniref:transporter n=1 Tax=Sphingobium sp. CFD-1 TaxID=2878545 RepID=UPI00214C5CC3|nr:transporter [Sphingobium sp. CFD-1]